LGQIKENQPYQIDRTFNSAQNPDDQEQVDQNEEGYGQEEEGNDTQDQMAMAMG